MRPPFSVDLSYHLWDGIRKRKSEYRLHCCLRGHWGRASHLCPVWLPTPVLGKASTKYSGISQVHFSTRKAISSPEWIEIWNSIHPDFLQYVLHFVLSEINLTSITGSLLTETSHGIPQNASVRLPVAAWNNLSETDDTEQWQQYLGFDFHSLQNNTLFVSGYHNLVFIL